MFTVSYVMSQLDNIEDVSVLDSDIEPNAGDSDYLYHGTDNSSFEGDVDDSVNKISDTITVTVTNRGDDGSRPTESADDYSSVNEWMRSIYCEINRPFTV